MRGSGAVKWWIRGCHRCQLIDETKHPKVAPLQSFPVFDTPMQRLVFDIVGPLPSCNGFRFIVTALYCCTHFPFAVPLKRHTVEPFISIFTQFSFSPSWFAIMQASFLASCVRFYGRPLLSKRFESALSTRRAIL